MGWAARRRFVILLIAGLVAAAFVAVLFIAVFYDAPSCADGIRNQDEAGVDCGGGCRAVCTADAQPPTVLFTQALPAGNGRADVIASVENKNASAAAKRVAYTLSLYGADRTLIAEQKGVLDLLPAASVPVFVPGIGTGAQQVSDAFLVIEPASLSWYRYEELRAVPTVSNVTLAGSTDAPRIRATLANASTAAMADVRAVVIVRGSGGNVIAASSTILPSIPGQSAATATFTWNRPFSEPPLSFEVVPVLGLP